MAIWPPRTLPLLAALAVKEMTDEEFEQYLQASLEEMEEKQEKLEMEFGLGHFDRFTVDYETCCLSFYEGEEMVLEASITPVASHVPDKDSLKWAWANESYPQEIREMAEFTKQLSELTGFELSLIHI